MNCLEIQECVPVFLDGEASPDLNREIEGHLEACDGCRAETERMKFVSAVFRSREPLEATETWQLGLELKLASIKRNRLAEEVIVLRRALEEMGARLRGLEEAEARRASERDVMTLDEVASYLQIPPETVGQMLDELPHIELNYELRFRRSRIDRWLEAREGSAAPEGFRWSDWIAGTSPYLSS